MNPHTANLSAETGTVEQMEVPGDKLSNGSLCKAYEFPTGTGTRSSSSFPGQQVRTLSAFYSSVHLHYTIPRPWRKGEIRLWQRLHKQGEKIHFAQISTKMSRQYPNLAISYAQEYFLLKWAVPGYPCAWLTPKMTKLKFCCSSSLRTDLQCIKSPFQIYVKIKISKKSHQSNEEN